MTRDEVMHLANATAGHQWMDEAHTQRFADALIKAEREACAKVCEETTAAWTQVVYNRACMDCADAIRARGEK